MEDIMSLTTSFFKKKVYGMRSKKNRINVKEDLPEPDFDINKIIK